MSLIDRTLHMMRKSDFISHQLASVGLEVQDLETLYDYCRPYISFARKVSSSYNKIVQAEEEKRNYFQYIEFALDSKGHFDYLLDEINSSSISEDEEDRDNDKYDSFVRGKYDYHFRLLIDQMNQYIKTSGQFKVLDTLEYGGEFFVQVAGPEGMVCVLVGPQPQKKYYDELMGDMAMISVAQQKFTLTSYASNFNNIYFNSKQDLNQIFRPHFQKWVKDLLGSRNWRFFIQYNTLKVDYDDGEEETIETDLSREIGTKILAYLEKGKHRSELFYGPPGSGKSNLMRAIAKKLGFSYLRLDKSVMQYHNEIISILTDLSISCILIDDIDWLDATHEMANFLHLLGQLNQLCSVVLGSSNHVKNLPSALNRPGRFDRLREVKFLDSEVHLKLVRGDLDLYAHSKNWPAAYILELVNRMEVEGKQEALNETDISMRIKRMNKEDYSLDENASLKLLEEKVEAILAPTSSEEHSCSDDDSCQDPDCLCCNEDSDEIVLDDEEDGLGNEEDLDDLDGEEDDVDSLDDEENNED